MKTQKERVLEYLQTGKTLSRLDGWDKLGVLETPARISELRQAGWPIETKMVKVKNRYGEEVKVANWVLLVDEPVTSIHELAKEALNAK